MRSFSSTSCQTAENLKAVGQSNVASEKIRSSPYSGISEKTYLDYVMKTPGESMYFRNAE